MDYHTAWGKDGSMIGKELGRILGDHVPLGVLVSGGCDSEVLLRAAAEAIGTGRVIALTAETPFIPDSAVESAKSLAISLGISHTVFRVRLMDHPGIAQNTSGRCYLCKKMIYSAAREEASRHKVPHLADGTNRDDTAMSRPGLQAAKEEGIFHPLASAGMTKSDVRILGRALGMPDPERPANSCLATRLEEDRLISREIVSLVESLEAVLKPGTKGRIRARVSGSTISLEHQLRDATEVMRNLDSLHLMAKASGYLLLPVVKD